MRNSSGPNQQPAPGANTDRHAVYRIECDPREGAVVFRCEACDQEIRDLRSVFLAHRAGAGWRIEGPAAADGRIRMATGGRAGE